jgi:hypothetical protein
MKLESIYEEMAMACFKVLFQNLPGGTKRDNEKFVRIAGHYRGLKIRQEC